LIYSDKIFLEEVSLFRIRDMIPDKATGAYLPLQRVMLPQDSGGAIRRHRVDIFFGNGPQAEYAAGILNQKGSVILLLVKEAALNSSKRTSSSGYIPNTKAARPPDTPSLREG